MVGKVSNEPPFTENNGIEDAKGIFEPRNLPGDTADARVDFWHGGLKCDIWNWATEAIFECRPVLIGFSPKPPVEKNKAHTANDASS